MKKMDEKAKERFGLSLWNRNKEIPAIADDHKQNKKYLRIYTVEKL